MHKFAKAAAKRAISGMPRIGAFVMALTVFTAATQGATAATTCVLPVPDGGDAPPSKANVEGRIVRAEHGFVEVARRSGQPIRVSYTDKTEFYSAFGGDYDPSELAVGQHVAIWFVACKLSRDGTGHAAYLQLYSRDQADQPPG
jgi:hypothetical protein